VSDQKTILIVDDDPFIRATTGTFLQSQGFRVIQAGNGQEGLDAFHAHEPDMVIVDLKMPIMNGLELLNRLTSTAPMTPVLVFSGEGGLDEAVEALRCGAWDYLIKPIQSMSILSHAVGRALERSALLREKEGSKQLLEKQVQQRTLELQNANLELERQFHKQQQLGIIGTLAGGMAHDFNNILSSIVCSAELLRSSISAEDLEDLDRIARSCSRGKSIIRSILHFIGKMNQEYSLFSLHEIMLETVDMLRATTPSRVSITTDFDDDLGMIHGDPTQIQQVIMNLGTNALHAMRKTDRPQLEIVAKICPEDEQKNFLPPQGTSLIMIRVRDNGAGIPSNLTEKLFEPFFTTKSQNEGTGLGLFVTRRIVQSLKGSIRIDSVESQGTTVRIYLPVQNVLLREPEVPQLPQLLQGNSEKILFIESNADVRASTGAVLCKLGYRVREATCMDEGLDLLRTDPDGFDLVLADENAPGSLHNLCVQIKTSRSRARIILTSSSPIGRSPAPPQMCMTLAKPLDLLSLGKTVRHCLDTCLPFN